MSTSSHDRKQAVALEVEVRRRVDPHQVEHGGKDIDEADDLARGLAARDIGVDDDQRHLRRLPPVRELVPAVLVAEMEAVVAPQQDRGIRRELRIRLERVEHFADLRVGIADRGEITVDIVCPLVEVGTDQGMLARRHAHRRHVGILLGARDHRTVRQALLERRPDLRRIVPVEILRRHPPVVVRPVDADAEEERLGQRAGGVLQEIERCIDRRVVGHRPGVAAGPEGEVVLHAVGDDLRRIPFCTARQELVEHDRPSRAADAVVMEELAEHGDVDVRRPQHRRQGDGRIDPFEPGNVVLEHPGLARLQARHDAGSRRVAYRDW